MEIAALVNIEKLNYETALETYALYHSLKKSGNQTQIIDYNYLDTNEKNLSLRLKNTKLYDFLCDNILFTSRRYEEIDELEDYLPLADIFVEFNPKTKENIFPEDKHVVYGVKGVNDYSDDEEKDKSNVLDPLLLLSKEEWLDFGERSNIKEKINEGYTLIYADRVTKDMLEYAKNIYAIKGTKVYIIADKVDQIIYKGKKINNATPADIVYLLTHATDVITTQNDGIKLSFIFEKKVHIFEDSNDSKKIKLVNELNLLDRIVTSYDKVILKDIENSKAVERVFNLRNESLELLKIE